ncbi:MAG: flagellar M-ring protein FliF [Gemmatimonadetes bacterium]|nr:flagellar M-ring protein FliF [Gemmatimonadota bacterium]
MQLFDAIGDFVRRVGAPRVVGMLVVLGIALGGIWGLVAWGNAPQLVAVVNDASLESVTAAQAVLETEGIENELSPSGAQVLVPAEKAAEARVALAENGVSAGRRPGFELFDEPSWGMTDFTQRINYRRALEGELERTIGQMRGITSAEVHLALRDGSVYQRQDHPVEASVLLSVSAGARPTSEQVEAITFLMASAVDGLTSEGVSVLDDAGRVLSAAAEPNGSRGDRRRMEMQLDLEERLETRVTQLLEPLVGPSNVRVRISAQLDLEQVERRTEAVDPNQQVLLGEARSEIEPGDPSQGAASTIQNNQFDVTRSTEISTRAPGTIERLTVAVALNEDLPRASDPTLVARIQELVSNAVGLDTGRGDAISVLAVPFESIQPTITPNQAPTTGPLDIIREFQRPIILAVALVLMFVLALRGLSMVRSALPDAASALPRRDGQAGTLGGGGGQQINVNAEGPGDVMIGGPNTADASRMVRAWLGEG